VKAALSAAVHPRASFATAGVHASPSATALANVSQRPTLTAAPRASHHGAIGIATRLRCIIATQDW
jgi:hypothetical protein